MCTGSHPFIPAENTAKAEFIYTTPGGRAENVLYFQKDGAISDGDITSLVDLLDGLWQGAVLPVQADAVTLQRITVTDVSTEDSFQSTQGVFVTGEHDNPIMPSNVTVAVSFRTGLVGRSNRGRLYHIGLTDDQVDGDTLTTPAHDAILAAYVAFFQGVALDGVWAHVIVSYCGDGEWRADAQITPVTDYLLDTTIDSMRRRLSGRGV